MLSGSVIAAAVPVVRNTIATSVTVRVSAVCKIHRKPRSNRRIVDICRSKVAKRRPAPLFVHHSTNLLCRKDFKRSSEAHTVGERPVEVRAPSVLYDGGQFGQGGSAWNVCFLSLSMAGRRQQVIIRDA
jgi:hypothetical protein